MIQIEEVHIEELRGIKNLTLNMGRKAFAIHGPNGSGKSGVVDAIEFGLTGDMTRLSGKGTAGLSVKTHGPHVDARDYCEASNKVLADLYEDVQKTFAEWYRAINKVHRSFRPGDGHYFASASSEDAFWSTSERSPAC